MIKTNNTLYEYLVYFRELLKAEFRGYEYDVYYYDTYNAMMRKVDSIISETNFYDCIDPDYSLGLDIRTITENPRGGYINIIKLEAVIVPDDCCSVLTDDELKEIYFYKEDESVLSPVTRLKGICKVRYGMENIDISPFES